MKSFLVINGNNIMEIRFCIVCLPYAVKSKIGKIVKINIFYTNRLNNNSATK